MSTTTITVLIDLPAAHAYHRATVDAIGHAADALGAGVSLDVVRTDALGPLGHGVVIGPGSPYRDPQAVESVIRAAREQGIPLVGT